MSAVNFLEQLKGGYPELYRELSSLGTEAAAIVPRYVSIVGNVEGGLIGKIRQIPGIESVESSKDRHIPVVGAFKALRWISRMIVLGIAFALLAGLFQLSRMNRQLHKDSISLLRSWGASPFATKAPVLLSSILVGSLGGILAAVAWWILGDQFFEHTRNLAPVFARLESPPFWIGPAVLGMGSLLGFISGIVDDA
jgi:cell division protein FtsX